MENSTKYSVFFSNVINLLNQKTKIIIKTNYVDKITDWDDKSLIKNINEIYKKKCNNIINHKKIGKIYLTNRTIDNTLSHKNGKKHVNVEMICNAPKLFKNAGILRITENFKNRNYDSYLCACLVKFKGENYIIEMVVNKYKKGTMQEFQRGYIINTTKKSVLNNYLSNTDQKTTSLEHHLNINKDTTTGTIITRPVFKGYTEISDAEASCNSIIIDSLQNVKYFEKEKNE